MEDTLTPSSANKDRDLYWPEKEDTSKSSKTKFSAFCSKPVVGKACICKYVRHIRQQAIENNGLPVPETVAPGTKEVNKLDMDDGGMQIPENNSGHLVYSLNKKGRWKLAERFREDIEHCGDTETDNVRVSAYEAELRPDRERPALRGSPVVKAFHTTHKGKAVHRYPADTFATASGLGTLEPKAPKRPRKKRVATFRRGVDPLEDRDGPLNEGDHPHNGDDIRMHRDGSDVEVVYELYTPSKSVSLFELARESQGSRLHDVRKEAPASKSKKFGILKESFSSAKDHLLLGDLPQRRSTMDSEDPGMEDPDQLEYIGSSGQESYAIWDYMVPAPGASFISGKHGKTGFKNNKARRKKEETICVEGCDDLERIAFVRRQLSLAAFSDSSEIPGTSSPATTPIVVPGPGFVDLGQTGPRQFEMVPLELQILTETLNPQYLKDKFQEQYFEAACIPRRFAVDVTESVGRLLPASLFGAESQFLCVFEAPPFSDQSGFSGSQHFPEIPETSFCRVWINGTFSEHVLTTFLETINPCQSHSVDQVVQAAVRMIGLLPEESFEPPRLLDSRPLVLAVPSALEPVKSSLISLTDQETKAMALKAADQVPNLQRQLSVVTKFLANSTENVDGGMVFARFCEVCCDEITLGWCLAACQHWFCQSCWLQFLDERILMGVTQVTCPEYGCSARVDFNILVTVLPLPLCHRFASVVQAHFVDNEAGSSEWCRCPNALCRRFVQFVAKPLPELILSCSCGVTWCRDCGENAHWPASCQHAKLYVEKLRHNGDDVAPTEKRKKITMVRVKQCPHCKQLMEKNEGCNHMSCRCGQAFCWSCAKPWEPAENHYKCQVKGNSGYEEVTLIDVHPFSAVFKDNWYKKCVQHHHAIDRSRLKTLRKAVRRIEGGSLCAEHRLQTGHLLEFYKQAHCLVEYAYVWLCFAKSELSKAVLAMNDRLHFLLILTEDAAQSGAVAEMTECLPKIKLTLERLVKLLLELKKAEYNAHC